jgi:hypothetical protein
MTNLCAALAVAVDTAGGSSGLLVIIYWVLLLLIFVGVFARPEWTWYPRANAVITFILFVIIGLKIVKPNW